MHDTDHKHNMIGITTKYILKRRFIQTYNTSCSTRDTAPFNDNDICFGETILISPS